jgi:hypothetical protein
MNINRHNYEVFFIDYIDGKLTVEQLSELKTFLSQNPDLEKDLLEFNSTPVLAENIVFADKNSLKKNSSTNSTINESNFDETSISIIEGDYDRTYLKFFLNYINQHPDKKKDFENYKKTILKPDLSIQFTNKQQLKHYKLNVRKIIVFTSAAASIALLIGGYLFVNNTQSDIVKNNYNTIVKSENNIIKEHIKTTIIAEKKETLNKPPKVKNTYIEVKKEPVKRENINIEQINNKPAIIQRSITNDLKLNRISENTIKTRNIDNYLTVTQYAEKEIEKMLPANEKLSLISLAKVGVNKLNKLVGIKYNTYTDTTKNIEVTEFEYKLLSYTSTKTIN